MLLLSGVCRMAEWLKKQAEREAEKEQRRLERLQRKLAEPKHQFTDPEFQQQCHDLSERLEDSVLKGKHTSSWQYNTRFFLISLCDSQRVSGLQASSSGQVKVDDVSGVKRANPDQSQQPKKKKKKAAAAGGACFWFVSHGSYCLAARYMLARLATVWFCRFPFVRTLFLFCWV